MRKLKKKNFDDWVLSTLYYHLVSIWSIFNAFKAFINRHDHPLKSLKDITTCFRENIKLFQVEKIDTKNNLAKNLRAFRILYLVYYNFTT
jgi:hypothetical protein